MSSNAELQDAIMCAQFSVRILGVTPIPLDWERIAAVLAPRLSDSSPLSVEILCESDNFLFNKALTSDTTIATTRISFADLRFMKRQAEEMFPRHLREFLDNGSAALLKNVRIETIHLFLPVVAVEVDGSLWIAEWLHEQPSEYRRLHPDFDDGGQYTRYLKYVEDMFRLEVGRKYSAPQESELLELFDHERAPRGIFPRQSFYDTDNSQLVIWGMVFDRLGRVLIHKRAANAKDNRDMWDKSVGGHVDFSMDPNTARAMARELVEELFTDEIKLEVGHHGIQAWNVKYDDIVYLGDWRPDKRADRPFREVKGFRNEWGYFSLRDSVFIYSPRTLPDGRTRRLRVIADVYLFVAGPWLNDAALGSLKNSKFKLLSVSDLKTAMDRAIAGDDPMISFDDMGNTPKFTPDLVNIMTGNLRAVLEDFSQHIRSYL